jgi:hypothetical protein
MKMATTSVNLERRRFRSQSGITPVGLPAPFRLQSAVPDDELSGSLYFHRGKVRSIEGCGAGSP